MGDLIGAQDLYRISLQTMRWEKVRIATVLSLCLSLSLSLSLPFSRAGTVSLPSVVACAPFSQIHLPLLSYVLPCFSSMSRSYVTG